MSLSEEIEKILEMYFSVYETRKRNAMYPQDVLYDQDLVKVLVNYVTANYKPFKEKPCFHHKLAFSKECPETTNIKDLRRCGVCGFLAK